MLYFPNTRQYVSVELPVAPGAVVSAEGSALIADTTAGVFGVRPSTGAATDNFIGVSVSQQMSLNFMSKVEEFVHPAGNVFTLARTPAAGTLSVYNLTTGAVVVAGAGGWTLAGRALTLDAATLGNTLVATYRFAPTSTEARTLQGDVYPGGPAGAAVNQVGVIKNGVIYTTEFDGAVNWRAANPTVRVGANGLFTIGGTGSIVNCAIVSVPSVAQPFLGLMLNG